MLSDSMAMIVELNLGYRSPVLSDDKEISIASRMGSHT